MSHHLPSVAPVMVGSPPLPATGSSGLLSTSISLNALYPAPTPPLPETPGMPNALRSPGSYSPAPVATGMVGTATSSSSTGGVLAFPRVAPKVAWRRKLVLVLVGLPARGKSYIAAKLLGYLRWRGLNASLFNVGKHRRHVAEKLEAAQSSDFFSPDNLAAKTARDEIAMEVLECMLDWLGSGGDVALFDATNTTAARRQAVLAHCQSRSIDLRVIFLESICDDEQVLDNNYRVKCMNSPDYAGMPIEAALQDLRMRVANYERIYEPIQDDDLSYIKVHNLASKVVANKIHGQLAHAIAAYLMSIHIRPRPLYFVRAGHSSDPETDRGAAELLGQQLTDRQILKPDAASATEDTPMAVVKHANFNVPYAVSMAANLDARGQSFATRLSAFITHKVAEYDAKREAAFLAGAHSGLPYSPPTSLRTPLDNQVAEAMASAVPVPAATAASDSTTTSSDSTSVSTAPIAAPLLTNTASGGLIDPHLPLVVYTSTLPRAIQTAAELKDRAYIFEPQSSLNMIDNGVCSGMSIAEIRERMPQELEKWTKHKYKYRFPGGESQSDRAKSLEPLVFELERQTLPVLVVSHMSTLQVLLGYFYGSKRSVDSYYSLWLPQHVVLELIPHAYGWQEIRHDLSEEACAEVEAEELAAGETGVQHSPKHASPVAVELGAPAPNEVERFNLQELRTPLYAVDAAAAAVDGELSTTVRPPIDLARPRSLMSSDRSISMPPVASSPSPSSSSSSATSPPLGATSASGAMFELLHRATGAKVKGAIGKSSEATLLGDTNFYDE